MNPCSADVSVVLAQSDIYVSLQMAIASRDDCTPVFLAQNISQHLSGTARTIGAALIGHFGKQYGFDKSLFCVALV